MGNQSPDAECSSTAGALETERETSTKKSSSRVLDRTSELSGTHVAWREAHPIVRAFGRG